MAIDALVSDEWAGLQYHDWDYKRCVYCNRVRSRKHPDFIHDQECAIQKGREILADRKYGGA